MKTRIPLIRNGSIVVASVNFPKSTGPLGIVVRKVKTRRDGEVIYLVRFGAGVERYISGEFLDLAD